MSKLAVDIGEKFGSPWGVGDFTLGYFVGIVVQAAIVIGGVIMVFLFILGGFSMITGAGSNAPEKVAKGKKAVTAALIGFIIIFASYWIVTILENILNVDIISNPSL